MRPSKEKINNSPFARWTVLIIVATAMMMGYFVNDVMSPLETLLELPKEQGGLGWTPSDYGFFSGAGSFINVFLLMLFFSGLILDRMGIRFTGTLACSLMALGTLIKYYAVTAEFGNEPIAFLDYQLPASAVWASLGFAIFGVGYEMTGISVSKAMVRWFTGHELALAMGIQLAMARLGTAAALSISAPIARHYTLSMPLLISLAFLIIGLLAFLVFCIMDRKLDANRASISSSSSCADRATEEGEEFHWGDILVTLRNPGFWLITLFCVLFYSAVSPFLKFSTKLMVMKYGVDPDIAGFFSSIAPFGTILMTPLFGLIYDRYGKGVTLVITGALMLTAVHFGFSLPMHSSTIAIALMVTLSIGYSLAPAALWPCVPKIIPLKCLGTAYSMIFFIQNFGRAVIPMCVGRANETDPTYTTSMLIFGFTALGAAVTAIAMLVIDKKKNYGLQLPNIKK
ncbi:Nitrate/nitrite transporter NarK [Xylanibacter ruminicola]|uniref:Lysosomal dipeptide transporter MFSD1 n=1 Tax=Xylanibacter ruminicola TaxID=839 RepID=A0A1M7GQE4_XYLRU|nr:MFS transporter [Xylanibacter ruminicola]SFC11508.1 Nitrate/nitrite transporter NarK [Xylanibacter ruminicola]SHM18574.1 Nitrate/nitrite transporter NarK [Xylanibacter ruminicola]